MICFVGGQKFFKLQILTNDSWSSRLHPSGSGSNVPDQIIVQTKKNPQIFFNIIKNLFCFSSSGVWVSNWDCDTFLTSGVKNRRSELPSSSFCGGCALHMCSPVIQSLHMITKKRSLDTAYYISL